MTSIGPVCRVGVQIMPSPSTVDRYLEPLLDGNRKACRKFIFEQLNLAHQNAEEVIYDVVWPAMEKTERLFRNDRINIAAEHMATRINRSIADQLQPSLTQMPKIGKRIIITCADGEPEELGAQMCADLFEARGWDVSFLGGGVPNDEILTLIGQLRPSDTAYFRNAAFRSAAGSSPD